MHSNISLSRSNFYDVCAKVVMSYFSVFLISIYVVLAVYAGILDTDIRPMLSKIDIS